MLLWGEHGLSGVLFLGEKLSGGPYNEEEIEVAQAGGERLLPYCAQPPFALDGWVSLAGAEPA